MSDSSSTWRDCTALHKDRLHFIEARKGLLLWRATYRVSSAQSFSVVVQTHTSGRPTPSSLAKILGAYEKHNAQTVPQTQAEIDAIKARLKCRGIDLDLIKARSSN